VQVPPQPRTMLGYVALPRPKDTVKWMILPAGFVVGSAGRGLPDGGAVLEAVVVWLALELLVYQARYQWNDIRGFEADQRHPDGDRGRLPGPLERRRSRVAWSAATAVAKVVLAIGLCLLAGTTAAWTIALLSAGVFALAAVYEGLRATSTGRSDEAPSPLTPGIVSIWVVIGGGYALRSLAGLGLAVDLTEPRLLLVTATLTCWAFGIAWITSRWAVEATAFSRVQDGRIQWQASSGHAREHQLALARWLPSTVPPGVRDLARWRAVRARPRWSAPWLLAGALATGSAAVSGALLTDATTPAPDLALCFAIGCVAGAVLVTVGVRREALTVLFAPLMVGWFVLAGVDQPLRAAVPWLVVAVAQACYLRQDRASLGTFGTLSGSWRRGTRRDEGWQDAPRGWRRWISTS
jgi:hypothetical protein